MSKNNKKILITSIFCGLFLINISTHAMKNNRPKKPTIPPIKTYVIEKIETYMPNLSKILKERLDKLTKFENEIKDIKNLNNKTDKERYELVKQKIIEISEFKKETDNLVYGFKKKIYDYNINISELKNYKNNSIYIYKDITDLLEEIGEKCKEIIRYAKENFKIEKQIVRILEKDEYTDSFINFMFGSLKQWIELQHYTLLMYYNNISNKFYTKKELNEILNKVNRIKALYKQKKLDLEKEFNEQNIDYYDIKKCTEKPMKKIDIYYKALRLNFKPHKYTKDASNFESEMEKVLDLINEKLKFSSLSDYNRYIETYDKKLEKIYQKIKDNDIYQDYEEIKNIYEKKIEEINKLASEIKDNNFSKIVNDICDSLKITCEKNKEEESSSINDDEKKFNEFKDNIMTKNDKYSEIVKLFEQSAVNIRKNISNLRSISKEKNSIQKINRMQNYVEMLTEYDEKLQNIYEEFLNNEYFKFSPYDNEELTNIKNEYKKIIIDLNEKIKKNSYNSENKPLKDIIEKTTNLLNIVIKDTTNVDEYIKNYKEYDKLLSELYKTVADYTHNEHVENIVKCYNLATSISTAILNIKQFDVIKQSKIHSLFYINQNKKSAAFGKYGFEFDKDISELNNEEIDLTKEKILNIYEAQKQFFETLDSIDPGEGIDILNLSDENLILKKETFTESGIIDFYLNQKEMISGENLTKFLNLLKYFLNNYYNKILNNSDYNKEKLKKDLENIKMMLSHWCKLTSGDYNKKILTLLEKIEDSKQKISKNSGNKKIIKVIENFITDRNKTIKKIPKNFDLKQNETYKEVLNLIEKIEKKEKIENNKTLDKTLKEFHDKFKKAIYDDKHIEDLIKLKEEYENYYNKRPKDKHFNKDELLLIEQIKKDGLAKIEKLTKEYDKNKKSNVDTKLDEFHDKFEKAIYDIKNIVALIKLKEDFENYYNKRLKDKHFNKDELLLIEQIKKDGLAKIEELTKEYDKNKKSKIDTKLHEFHDKFKKAIYDDKHIEDLINLKDEYEEYINERIHLNNGYNTEELQFVEDKNFDSYLYRIEELTKEYGKNKKSNVDTKLHEFHDKFEKAIYDDKHIEDLIKLKKEYEEYIEKRVNSNNSYNDEEYDFAEQFIVPYLDKIEKLTKEYDKNKKSNIDTTLNKPDDKFEEPYYYDDDYYVYDLEKVEKDEKSNVDTTLGEFYEKFENATYDDKHIEDLKKLKEEYGKYYNKRLKDKDFNEYELLLVDQIKENGLAKIEKLTKEYDKNKKSNVNTKLYEFHDKFEKAIYDDKHIKELKKLKKDFEEYDNERLESDNYYNEEEFDLAQKITRHIEDIKKLIKKNSENAKFITSPFNIGKYSNIENGFDQFEKEDEKSKIDNSIDYYGTFFKKRKNNGPLNENKTEYNKNNFNLTETNKKSRILSEYLNFKKVKDNNYKLNKEKTLEKDINKTLIYKINKENQTTYDKLKTLENYLNDIVNERNLKNNEEEEKNIISELEKYEEKFENFDCYKSYTSDFEKLKEEFENYISCIIKVKPLNSCAEELSKKIYDKIHKIEDKFIEIAKKEKKIDNKLIEYEEKFDNFDCNNSNISDFKKLKGKFEEYKDTSYRWHRLQHYEEKLLVIKIYNKIFKIEYKIAEKKEIAKIYTKLKGYEEKFKNLDCNKSDISDFKELEKEFEYYTNTINDKYLNDNVKELTNVEELINVKKLVNEIYGKIINFEDYIDNRNNKKPLNGNEKKLISKIDKSSNEKSIKENFNEKSIKESSKKEPIKENFKKESIKESSKEEPLEKLLDYENYITTKEKLEKKLKEHPNDDLKKELDDLEQKEAKKEKERKTKIIEGIKNWRMNKKIIKNEWD